MHAASAEKSGLRTDQKNSAILFDNQELLSAHDVFVRVGVLTRNLHDTLRQLGYDKSVEDAVGSLPKVRARLDCIANLTGKAAERAKAMQGEMRTSLDALRGRWNTLLEGSPSPRALWELGRETQECLAASQAQQKLVDDELSEILLAQDFHALTGQNIQRITLLAQQLEEQLFRLLIDASPPAHRKDVLEKALAGTMIDGEFRDGAVNSRTQMEYLLKSLGF